MYLVSHSSREVAVRGRNTLEGLVHSGIGIRRSPKTGCTGGRSRFKAASFSEDRRQRSSPNLHKNENARRNQPSYPIYSAGHTYIVYPYFVGHTYTYLHFCRHNNKVSFTSSTDHTHLISIYIVDHIYIFTSHLL